MPNTSDFLTITTWTAILTLVIAVLTVAAFIFQWGIRFRMVGVTSFMIILTGGFFTLSLVPFTRTEIPGAARYSLVFDNGGNQVVIVVPPTITESALEATLRQASSDLFSYGRLGGPQNVLSIRARTVIHPEADISKPLYLGRIQRSLATREDENAVIDIYPESFAQLPEEPSLSQPIKEEKAG